jgi:hypothetical protein
VRVATCKITCSVFGLMPLRVGREACVQWRRDERIKRRRAHAIRNGWMPPDVRLVGSTTPLTLAHTLRLAALGGGLVRCELTPLTLLVI